MSISSLFVVLSWSGVVLFAAATTPTDTYTGAIKPDFCRPVRLPNSGEVIKPVPRKMENAPNIPGVGPQWVCELPETWPDGTYGLPKPTTGCPNRQFTWEEGERKHDTEDDDEDNQWSTNPFPLEGRWNWKNNMEQHFCVKTNNREGGSLRWSWQPGTYCIFKYRNCPSGFQTGSLFWDDDDDEYNSNSYSGTLPDGVYDDDTLIHFCCREDGPTNRAIVLPTEDNFVLFPLNSQCQAVRGMSSTKEWFLWDNENTNNEDSQTLYHPYEGVQGGGGNIRLHYCFYQRY